MPKRDEAYMQAQRRMIALAALEVLLEKGLYETSLRDICKAAGISIGALYIHFPTKEAAVVAACALDFESDKQEPPAKTWEEYIAPFAPAESIDIVAGRAAQRYRLSLQLVAELIQYDRNPEGLSAIYQVFKDRLAAGLGALKANGVIVMPLGVELTTELHMQIMGGLNYRLASDRDADRTVVLAATRAGLAMTAGLPAP